MAARRFVHDQQSYTSSDQVNRYDSSRDGAVSRRDAVRLAESLNMDADVHTLLTRQHVTTHVRDNTSEVNRTARKSGVRKVTTRVVRSTTTITRGEQQSVTENLSRHYSHRDDTTVTEEKFHVPAITYRNTFETSKRAKVHNTEIIRENKRTKTL